VQAKGWLQGSYFSTYSPFDAQMVPSGLMGPVQIEGVRVVARRRPGGEIAPGRSRPPASPAPRKALEGGGFVALEAIHVDVRVLRP